MAVMPSMSLFRDVTFKRTRKPLQATKSSGRESKKGRRVVALTSKF